MAPAHIPAAHSSSQDRLKLNYKEGCKKAAAAKKAAEEAAAAKAAADGAAGSSPPSDVKDAAPQVH